jgi:hypothetical protein
MCTKSPNHKAFVPIHPHNYTSTEHVYQITAFHKSQHRDGDGIPCTVGGACWRGLHFAGAELGAPAVVEEALL